MTQTMNRIFRSGSIQMNDPDPSLTPEKVKDLYAVNHPHLAGAVIEGPTTEGNNLIYEFKPAPVKTKG